MKANFVLRPDNSKRFIETFKHILGITGAIVNQSEYKGQRAIKKMLLRHGFKDWVLSPIPVVKTCQNFTLKDDDNFKIRLDAKGVVINFNYCSGHLFPWGTKMRITTNRIYIFEKPSYSLKSHITTIQPFSDLKVAKRTNDNNESYDRQYYRDMMEELERDFVMDEEDWG